jgi:hypothetical protein
MLPPHWGHNSKRDELHIVERLDPGDGRPRNKRVRRWDLLRLHRTLKETTPMDDREGLKATYALIAVLTRQVTRSTSRARRASDAWDGLKIPFAQTSRSQRYADASRTLKTMPQIRWVDGHSLGGAVALQLQQKNPGVKSVTYGPPVVSASGGERYRQLGEPMAVFDLGAKTTLPGRLNPHNYKTQAGGRHEFA